MRSIYENQPIDNVSCPLCLAHTGQVLYKVTASDSAKTFVRPAVNPEIYRELVSVITGRWGAEECRQVRCDGCRCVYAWPHRGGDARFYNMAFREHMRYPQNRWEFSAAMRFLKPGTDGPILELGAGDGAFVRKAAAAALPASGINAVEYSEAARAQLTAIDSKIKVFAGLEEFVDGATPDTYSHVFAFQVLEHVERPVDYLRTFRRVLRTGGLICMAVPNPAHIEANEQNGLLLDMPPNHITRFTVQGISSVAAQAGFEVIHAETEPFVYRDWLREFLSYHFKRRTQIDGTVQNWMERTLPWRLATIAGAAIALPSALLHSFESNQGGSLFCVLRAV